jgi:hypothetical protein
MTEKAEAIRGRREMGKSDAMVHLDVGSHPFWL